MTRSQTELTQRRYNRLARFYDLMETPMERMGFSAWRRRLREGISGERALEVGVGTGKNLPFYPSGVRMAAIDLSPRMLGKAQHAAEDLGAEVDLQEMDVQDLGFPDNSFDTVFATFVFCSVPDPVLGLKELRRVCKPGGTLLLMEHVRPPGRLLGWISDLLNPLVVRVMGANINRRTRDNLGLAGWETVKQENLAAGLVWWLEARPQAQNIAEVA